MLRHLFALILLPCMPLSASPALGQTSPAQARIVCDIKDNVEDTACRNKLKGLFTRKGDALTLRLDGAKSKTYVGNLAEGDGENADVGKVPRLQSAELLSTNPIVLGPEVILRVRCLPTHQPTYRQRDGHVCNSGVVSKREISAFDRSE